MQQELSKYLGELLFYHDRLSVPGLGTFELRHAPALIDQVQGQVSAPAKNIQFNPNLVMDDGLLTDFIQQRLGWSLSETKQWLARQVAEMNAALDRKEIVELPGVGRFFRNFENQLQFVAENVNFNLDSYGLQKVAGQLVPRAEAEKIPALKKKLPTTPPTKSTTTAPKQDLTSIIAANLTWVLAGVLVLVLVMVYTFYPRKAAEGPDNENIANLPQERLNASPSRVPEEETAPAPSNEDGATNPLTGTPERPVEEDSPADTGDSETDTEAPTLAPEEHSAVIAVGLFGNPDNVQRLLEQLSKEGYAPISRPENGNTRVGVSVRYEQERELQRILREIRDKYASSAFILTRDGEEVNER
ncbi:MAG: SPOR domain-containing protein [Bacteroidota bacterium]